MSTGAKVGIGTGIALLSGFGIVYGIKKSLPYITHSIRKRSLIKVNLDENIEFKEAQTLQEAIDFAKNVLKIKEVDKNFTLEALNFVNKGLVNISNANKGNFYQFRELLFTNLKNMPDNLFAGADIVSGSLLINSKYFDDKFLTSTLNKLLYKDGEELFCIGGSVTKKGLYNWMMVIPFDKETGALVQKFYNKETLTIKEKQDLIYTMLREDDVLDYMLEPMVFLEKFKEKFEKNGIKIDLEKIALLSKEKQVEFMKNAINEIEIDIVKLPLIKRQDALELIYHEAGHLEDLGFNFDRLQHTDNPVAEEKKWIANRNSIYINKDLAKLLKNNPEKMKKEYPEMYEFLTDDKIQRTAGYISSYAKTGITEFIAETYARMISIIVNGGDPYKELPQNVIALYKRYNGPEVAAYKMAA